MKRWTKFALAGAGAYVGLRLLAIATAEKPEIDADNPYLTPEGEPSDSGEPSGQEEKREQRPTLYERYGKRFLDTALSFAGLVALAPVYGVIAAAVWLDDPGPVFFAQKRVGADKRFFLCHKFRTMKLDAPHNVPTHLLQNPEQYITRTGKFLRKTSLDELPQVWDTFRHKLSLVGPRPALWNQADLIAERERYGANGVTPGITGWAQINGRDELPISVKAELDGEYVRRLRQGGWKAFLFDCKCILGTVSTVATGDGVVEGGTGAGKQPGTEENSAGKQPGTEENSAGKQPDTEENRAGEQTETESNRAGKQADTERDGETA